MGKTIVLLVKKTAFLPLAITNKSSTGESETMQSTKNADALPGVLWVF